MNCHMLILSALYNTTMTSLIGFWQKTFERKNMLFLRAKSREQERNENILLSIGQNRIGCNKDRLDVWCYVSSWFIKFKARMANSANLGQS